MFIDSLWLLAGLILILFGANFLTDGAASVAKRLGVSDLLVGLTVVAFGTSTPELVISVISAVQGNAGVAIGNIVGGNIFNILAIIGITAIVRPMKVEPGLLTKDIPLVVLSSLVLLAMGNSRLLDSADASILSRVDGIVLLLFFAIFLRYTFSLVKVPSGGENNPDAEIKKIEDASGRLMSVWKSLLWIFLGLGALIYGGDRFVDGASGIAAGFGVSDAVIGLTVVAVGTSLPELATSIAAALKGNADMAIGNVIGSCIFNAFMVLGCAATVRPLPFGSIGNFDLLVMTGACFLFWLFGQFFKKRTITRLEGLTMTLCYIAYVVILVIKAIPIPMQ